MCSLVTNLHKPHARWYKNRRAQPQTSNGFPGLVRPHRLCGAHRHMQTSTHENMKPLHTHTHSQSMASLALTLLLLETRALRAISFTCKLTPTSPHTHTLAYRVCVFVCSCVSRVAALLALSKGAILPCCFSRSLKLDTKR